MELSDVSLFVIDRLYQIRQLPESEFRHRAEELMFLYHRSFELFQVKS